MQTCHGVKIHAAKKMRDGAREWSVPSFAYYAGRKNGQLQTTTNHYAATSMTLALAEQVTQKLNSSGLETTVCDLFADPDALIHDNLISVGEEEAPAVAPPGSLQNLSHAIEKCFREDRLTPLEVLTFAIKTVLCC